MDRRSFLRWGATRAGIVALFFLGGAAALIGHTTIAKHLRDTFWYLDVSDDDLVRFGDAYVAAYGHPGRGEFGHVESVFLLSTDFFSNGADETRPVNFVAIYHPYVTACLNPLATFDP